MRNLSLILALCLTLGLHKSLLAAESTQSSNQSTAQQAELAPATSDRKDIDEEITNKKLRAELGSKSKWSIRNTLSYQGGSIEKPLDEERPNYRSSSGIRRDVYSYANIAVKYRVTDHDNLNLGTGITILKPFHRTAKEASSKSENFNVSNPYLEYNRAYKAGSAQMVSSVSGTVYTESFDTDAKNGVGDVGVAQTVVGDIGNLAAGATASFGAYIYKDSAETFFNPSSRRIESKSQYLLGIYPFAEYTLSKHFSVRTVFGWFNYEKLRTEEAYQTKTPYQSLGVGISLTRDIYLYPNVQFVPNDTRAERTNVNLSANINLL